LHRRDPQGEPQQVRVGPRAGPPRARSLPLLVGRLSDRLRLHPRDAGARRRPAGRHGLRLRADLPRLHDRREADRPLPHGGRKGSRRQSAVRAPARPGLEYDGEARGPARAAPRRDRPLLLDLQGPGAQEGQGGRLAFARGRDQGDRGVAGAPPRLERQLSPRIRPSPSLLTVRTAAKLGIVALVALALFALPGGGAALNIALTALTIAFFVAIGLLGYRLYREHRFDIESLAAGERLVLYGSVGVAFLAFTATNRLFD